MNPWLVWLTPGNPNGEHVGNDCAARAKFHVHRIEATGAHIDVAVEVIGRQLSCSSTALWSRFRTGCLAAPSETWMPAMSKMSAVVRHFVHIDDDARGPRLAANREVRVRVPRLDALALRLSHLQAGNNVTDVLGALNNQLEFPWA